ncbi:MAG: hypothetical protein JWN08_871, partial [Frankiales bacterium]|nr:hypothetical protein [Frankiales bacterium]
AKPCKPATCPAPALVTAPASRVVVADVDSGINPYHADYYRGPSEVTPDVLAEFPGIRTITLTRTGDFAADLAADRAVWDAVQLGQPYWFAGTNVIGVSFDPDTPTRILADAGDEHGVGTSSAVLDANPEAVVLFVEGVNADSETYAFTHPAVDVVTTSYGIPGSVPTGEHLASSYDGTVNRGKLHFGASDNSPALSPPDGTSGPWWTIGVAGFHEDTSGGREALSGNLVDVVADFTQTLPYCSDCESGRSSASGTSFATPRAAGTASKVLLEARRAAGHVGGPVVKAGLGSLAVAGTRPLTPWQLRRAFEQAATYPDVAAYDPQSALLDDLGTSVPVNPVAPYLQVGWGVFAPAVVGDALAHLGFGGTPSAAKSAEACAFNNATIDLRHAYWDQLALSSESAGQAGDPYLYCS